MKRSGRSLVRFFAAAVLGDLHRTMLPVLAIATLADLLAWIGTRDDLVQHRDSLVAYRADYGTFPA